MFVGGTQANATVIDAILPPWQGVVAPASGHVSVHEADAIERNGHKVIELPKHLGKITAAQVEEVAESWEADANREHMVMPGLVYVSQPSEYGTLYSRSELEALSETAHAHGMRLFIDGARLAYALAAPNNDATLEGLARLCDAFCIGGTKCGALFGEAVVVPDPNIIPRFFTQIKQHGALLAKGRILGIQFEVLFEDGLYERIGKPAVEQANRIREALASRGAELRFGSTTNQTFMAVKDSLLGALSAYVEYGFWEKPDDDRTVIRFATSWASASDNVDAPIGLIEGTDFET
ncbi:aminotransferase class I/II-fold pyridoxal phosphate-dependent enzyme [Slackia exigua]